MAKANRVVDGYNIASKRVGRLAHTTVGTSFLYKDRVYRVTREGSRHSTTNGWGCYRLLTLRDADGNETTVADSVLCREGYRAGGPFDFGLVYVRKLEFAEWDLVFVCGCSVVSSRGELFMMFESRACDKHVDTLDHALKAAEKFFV